MIHFYYCVVSCDFCRAVDMLQCLFNKWFGVLECSVHAV